MSATKHRPQPFFNRMVETFGKMSGLLAMALLIGVMTFVAVYVIAITVKHDDPFDTALEAMRIIGFFSFILPWFEFLVEAVSLSWHRGKRRAEGGE